jgi:ubiquinone/menaquinone biosynthesis C-methylase UbiE
VNLPAGTTAPAPSAAWSKVAANYNKHIVPGFRPAARALCDALRVGAGDRVLDIACGPGTVALEALRLGASEVLGVDFSAEMVALARREAAGKGQAEFVEGDATALPVLSEAYDVAMSAFGIIFAPQPRLAMAEMHRVVAQGGRAGILTWPRTGNMGKYYETVFRHLPKPEQGFDPYEWGEREKARKWFGEWFGYLEFQAIDVPYVAPSAEQAWDLLKVSTGRVAVAYEKLDPAGQKGMDAAMIAYFRGYLLPDGSVRWPREALMLTGTK